MLFTATFFFPFAFVVKKRGVMQQSAFGRKIVDLKVRLPDCEINIILTSPGKLETTTPPRELMKK